MWLSKDNIDWREFKRLYLLGSLIEKAADAFGTRRYKQMVSAKGLR